MANHAAAAMQRVAEAPSARLSLGDHIARCSVLLQNLAHNQASTREESTLSGQLEALRQALHRLSRAAKNGPAEQIRNLHSHTEAWYVKVLDWQSHIKSLDKTASLKPVTMTISGWAKESLQILEAHRATQGPFFPVTTWKPSPESETVTPAAVFVPLSKKSQEGADTLDLGVLSAIAKSYGVAADIATSEMQGRTSEIAVKLREGLLLLKLAPPSDIDGISPHKGLECIEAAKTLASALYKEDPAMRLAYGKAAYETFQPVFATAPTSIETVRAHATNLDAIVEGGRYALETLLANRLTTNPHDEKLIQGTLREVGTYFDGTKNVISKAVNSEPEELKSWLTSTTEDLKSWSEVTKANTADGKVAKTVADQIDRWGIRRADAIPSEIPCLPLSEAAGKIPLHARAQGTGRFVPPTRPAHQDQLPPSPIPRHQRAHRTSYHSA